MDTPPDRLARILVVARPVVGRKVETVLRSAGHEVHHTADPSASERLAARLRPGVVVVALDLSWGDALDAANRMRDGKQRMPVLVLGNDRRGGCQNGFPHLPLDADAGELRAAVADLLAPTPNAASCTVETDRPAATP